MVQGPTLHVYSSWEKATVTDTDRLKEIVQDDEQDEERDEDEC
ncbi:MAG: hypothetical protein QG582_191 [Candidatus Thermoplasmatota archaeon]|nr:hypothetical protein [Candidatus Thermoplasmatota archaeon]